VKARGSFDAALFAAVLDGVRASRAVSWREVARQTGVSSATLTRIGKGHAPDADNLLALAAWAGLLDMRRFLAASAGPAPR
jgi:transcriptional regulator with XRE-family HTH domain